MTVCWWKFFININLLVKCDIFFVKRLKFFILFPESYPNTYETHNIVIKFLAISFDFQNKILIRSDTKINQTLLLFSTIGIKFGVVNRIEQSYPDVVFSDIGTLISYFRLFDHLGKSFNVESLFAFLKEKVKRAVFHNLDRFDSKLEVDLQDEGVLKIYLFWYLPHFIGFLLFLDNFGHVFRDLVFHFVLIFINKSIIQHICIGKPYPSECFLHLNYVYLVYSFIIENIPFSILKGFYVAEIMTCVWCSTVHQNRI